MVQKIEYKLEQSRDTGQKIYLHYVYIAVTIMSTVWELALFVPLY